MKYFKNAAGEVFAFESDGSQDAFITPDLIAISEQEADEIRFPEPTTDKILAYYTAVIQSRLDDFAKTRGYDSCLSCCTYVNSQFSKFAIEAQYMLIARDDTWVAAYDQLKDYQEGGEQPSLDSVLAALPELAWPN